MILLSSQMYLYASVRRINYYLSVGCDYRNGSGGGAKGEVDGKGDNNTEESKL